MAHTTHDSADMQAVTSNKQAKKTPPRDNLPLPRELRDEIYGYLLDPEYTQYTPAPGAAAHSGTYRGCDGHAHTYKFHTEIMRVNKTIGGEAVELFYRRNTLVSVSWQSPGSALSTALVWHAIGVPILADGVDEPTTRAFQSAQHSWYLKVTTRAKFADADGTAHSPYKALVLTRDFDKLCDVLRAEGLFTTPGSTYVLSQLGQPIRLAKTISLDSARITISSIDTPRKSKYPADRNLSLQIAHAAFQAGYALQANFANSDDPLTANIREIQAHSTPALVFQLASEWQRFDALTKLKQQADAATLSTPVGRWAQIPYAVVMRYWEYGAKVHLQGDTNPLFSAVPTPRSCLKMRWQLLLFDVFLTRFWQLIHQDHLETAVRILGSISADQIHCMYPPALNCLRHAGLVLSALGKGSATKEDFVGDIRQIHTTNHDSYAKHDARILMDACLQAVDDAHAVLDAPIPMVDPQLLSVHTMPLRTFNFSLDENIHGVGDLMRRPTGLVGWTDTEHLAQLTGEEKEDIKTFQEQHHLSISKFE